MNELNLRQIRKAKEYSQQYMADRLNVHVNTYIRWEEEPNKIAIEMCYKICEALGVEYNPRIFLAEMSTKCCEVE